MRSLVLWPTGRCNLQCRYCYAANGCKDDMTCETAEKAVEQMAGKPYKIQLAGGEPLLNLPLVRWILEYAGAQENCKGISIQTNATLIDRETAGLLKKHGAAVGVSLDGMPATNEAQRGGTKAAVQGIKALAGQGMAANLTCVVTACNAAGLNEVADMAVYLGNIRGIGLDLLRKAGRAADDQDGIAVTAASEEELLLGMERLCTRVETLNRALPPGRRLIIRELEKARQMLAGGGACKDYCYAAQGTSFVVLPDGECYPCGSLAGHSKFRMGNVHTEVHRVKISCEVPECCGKCRYAGVCTGGCPSRGLLCGGFDPLDCVIKKYMFEKAEKQEEKNEKK